MARVPLDTTTDAQAVQDAVYRRLGGTERLAIAFRLTETIRGITMAGIRSRHPGYSDAEVRLAYARLVLGDVLVRAVWPGVDLVEP